MSRVLIAELGTRRTPVLALEKRLSLNATPVPKDTVAFLLVALADVLPVVLDLIKTVLRTHIALLVILILLIAV